jgi:transitional endoplasmic reticulum ATPase
MEVDMNDKVDAKKQPNWDKFNPVLKYEGRKITLPGDPAKMPLRKGIEALERLEKDELQTFNVHEVFDAYPTDAAVAMVRAMTKLYGWASPEAQQTFFGPQPPEMLSVKIGIGIDEVVQVPIGQFRLPGIDKPITTVIHKKLGFIIFGEICKRDRHVILELATETRKFLKESSIYRGKPIRLMVDYDGNLMTGAPPEFMDVTNISEVDLIFDKDVQDQINTNLLVPIKETAACRKYNIPLKRGVLLEGPFGTGKSLTARLTARVAETAEQPWTFVLLDKVQGLRPALEFALKYAPAVVFAEDIDRIIAERTDAANDLINTIDGVCNKNSEVMVVLTTNHVEKINPVILRPGRLDAVISLRPPTGEACERLIRHYAGKLLATDADLKLAAQELKGQIPASIRECVERAKLSMIGRRDDSLNGVDIVIAAKSMSVHMALLNPKAPEPSIGDKLAESLRRVTNGHDKAIAEIHETVVEIRERV